MNIVLTHQCHNSLDKFGKTPPNKHVELCYIGIRLF